MSMKHVCDYNYGVCNIYYNLQLLSKQLVWKLLNIINIIYIVNYIFMVTLFIINTCYTFRIIFL